MAIDIRAAVSCSLGTLISASISDDYVQGTGLIKTKGNCEISGLITPAIGTVVTFSYTRDAVTKSVPRKLRVMSSFADPFRRTTTVELGCKLTYLSDLKEQVKWTAFDDSENSSLTVDDQRTITIPIYAKSAMNKCLTQLGISASSNPLTNAFSIAEFDFSTGWVEVLSNLLVSESYCGYLDSSEVLQVFSLDQVGGTGPVLNATKIIDLGPIGVGQLPGEAVTVSYSTLKLKQPDNTDTDGSESQLDSNETSTSYTVTIPYTDTDGISATRDYTVYESTKTTTYFTTITTPTGENLRLPSRQTTVETTNAVALAGGLVTEYLSNGISFVNTSVSKTTEESYTYDSYGKEKVYERRVDGSAGYLAGSAGVTWVFSPSDYVTINFGTTHPIESERRETTYFASTKKVTSYVYGPWARTITGQQSIAAGRESFTSSSQVADYLNNLYRPGLALLDSRVTIEPFTPATVAPDQASVTNAANADGGDPNNGYRTESTAQMELAVGSATAQRRIEFSLPYAPDDTFYKVGSSYYAKASDAPEKARRYGRVQNRLLLGNRNGMNLQVAADLLPSAPFAPVVVQANGLSALYRVNGSSWTMDANGIVAATDALFWGAVGGTGSFWFPVAPGVTSLPTTPAVVDGQMSVAQVVAPFNETVLMAPKVRSTLSVTSYGYTLTPPAVSITAKVRTILSTATVLVSAITCKVRTTLVASSTLVNGPTFVLWHFDGTDGATTITSTSATSITATVAGNAQLDTAQQKFGTASLLLDGTGDYIYYDAPTAPGTGDFTVEMWIRPANDGTDFLGVTGIGDTAGVGLVCDIDPATGDLSVLDSSSNAIFHQTPVSFNTWTHIAIYRIGTQLYCAINGEVCDTPATSTIDITDASHTVGAYDPTGAFPFKGHIDEVRYNFTEAVYGTTNFTAPTAAFTD